VHGINVTDGSGAILRACPLAVAKAVLDAGADPILQMTCRDRNRLALQADLLGASILGIRNVLLLTGDDPKSGDHPEAKPVFDISSADLLKAAKSLSEGHDMSGNELNGVPRFCIGSAADPGTKDLNAEMDKFKSKVDAGAEFFQTQVVFDVASFSSFMEKAKKFGRPVLAGILLIKSSKMARYMNEKVFGIHVPEETILRFEKASDKRAECVSTASELIKQVRNAGADGIHLYPLGWDELVPDILNAAGADSR
jgi:5,10-methylenetetrahydrofolate reductase